MLIAGVDEAGRGALAGPVVAGCVILQEEQGEVFFDSKQLTEKKREELFRYILANCDYGVGIISAAEIDEIGIKKATEKAMNIAVKALKGKPGRLLVDGRDKFEFPIESEDIVKGDEKEQCIAAASIVAKVTRDRLMIKYGDEYPSFGFADHKGYGARIHYDMLDQGIFCDIHRKTYDPLKTWLHQGRLF